MKMKHNKFKKGFSLVECIVALAVISIITVIALVVISSTVKNVRNQWDNYCVTVTADNILACFQASEDVNNDFSNIMTRLGYTESGAYEEEFKITDYVKYDEYNVTKRMVPKEFKTLRAYENGPVNLYSQDYTEIRDNTSKLVSMPYSDDSAGQGKYATDSEKLMDTEIYVEKANGGDEITSITAYYYASTNVAGWYYYRYDSYTVFKDTDNVIKTRMTYDYYYTRFLLDDKTENRMITREATPLEKYLFENKQILVYDTNSWYVDCSYSLINGYSEDGYRYFYLYNADGTRVKEGSNYVYLLIYGTNENDDKDWFASNDGRYFKVTDIRKYLSSYDTISSAHSNRGWRYSHSSQPQFVDGNNNPFASSGNHMNWYGLPAFIAAKGTYIKGELTDANIAAVSLNTTGEASRHTLRFNDTEPISGSIACGRDNPRFTDYYFVNGETSNVCYAVKKTDVLELYNSADVLLYTYTGSKIDEAIASLGFSADDSYNVTGAERYCKYQEDIIITGVRFIDAESRIVFCSGAENSELFWFVYDSPIAYQNDKDSVTSAEGIYKDFYSPNGDFYTLRNQKGGSLQKTASGFEVVVEDDVIFNAHTQDAEAKYSDLGADGGGFIEVESETTGIAVTKWYSFTQGNYACISRVTFSEDSSVRGIQPQIKTWIVSKDTYDNWKKYGATPTQEAYYHYKKG